MTRYSLPSLPLYSSSLWSFEYVLNSWTQNCQFFRVMKVCPTKAWVPSKICNNFIIMVHALVLFISCNVFKDFWGKKVSYFYWFKDHWNKVYSYSEPAYYFWISLFFHSLHATRVHEHFKLCTHLLSTQLWMSHKPVDISRYTSCIRLK